MGRQIDLQQVGRKRHRHEVQVAVAVDSAEEVGRLAGVVNQRRDLAVLQLFQRERLVEVGGFHLDALHVEQY
jgi:hypothetical protein